MASFAILISDIFLNFILFLFGCSVSLLLHRLFCSCSEQGLLSSYGAGASHCGGFSCGAQALGHGLQLFLLQGSRAQAQ